MSSNSFRIRGLLFCFVLVAMLAGCASTNVVSSWKDPALDPTRLGKMLVVFQDKDPGIRRAMEDEIAGLITNATPSYRVLDDSDLENVESAKSKVKAAGFDTAVVMRVVSLDRELTYVPGTMATGPVPYGRMWGGYWRYGWGRAYDPGYYRTDERLTVGTALYSIAEDKLVYSSRSQSFNPGDMSKTLKEIVDANAKELAPKK